MLLKIIHQFAVQLKIKSSKSQEKNLPEPKIYPVYLLIFLKKLSIFPHHLWQYEFNAR